MLDSTASCKHDRHRQIVQAPVQTPLIDARSRIEAAVDVVRELFLPAPMFRVGRL